MTHRRDSRPRDSKEYHFSTIGGNANVHAGDNIRIHTGAFTGRQQFHQALKTSNYESFKLVNVLPAPRTCRWVVDHTRYRSWLHSNYNDLLWLSADPGCGKSVLCRGLTDGHLLHTTSTRSPKERPRVLHFFFKDNCEQNKLNTALCALSHQLYKDTELLRTVETTWNAHGYRLLQDNYELWRSFLQAARESTRPLVCVIDALDECDPADAELLVDWLCTFYTSTTDVSSQRGYKATIKFIVTSRPYDTISRQFSKVPQVRLRGEDENLAIKEEIDGVIYARVSDLATHLGLSRICERRVRKYLQAKNNRTYLWLTLAIEDITQQFLDCANPENLDVEMLSVPESLEGQYERLLDRIRDQRRARKLLTIMLGAKRSLNLAEMACALTFALRLPSEQRIDALHLRKRLPEWCGLFVFVDNSDRLLLIHETAKDFLQTRKGSKVTGWKGSVSPSSSELQLAEICVHHILYSLPASAEQRWERHGLSYKWTITLTQPSNPYSDLLLRPSAHRRISHRRCSVCTPFRDLDDYAITFWSSHVRRVSLDENPALRDKICHLYNTKSGCFQTWFFRTESLSGLWPLDLALQFCTFDAYSGDAGYVPETSGQNSDLAHLFYDTDSDDDSGSASDETAVLVPLLPIVAWQEELFVLQRLYSSRAFDLDALTINGHSALTMAIRQENRDTVRWLIQHGASTESRSSSSVQTPLHAAATNGDHDIIKLLLRAGADIDAIQTQSDISHNALSIAVSQDDFTTVKLLLASRPRRSTVSAALQIAATSYIEDVELLLDAGVDPDIPDEQGLTALLTAVGHDRIQTCRVLLDAGADVDVQDPRGRTPLDVAVQSYCSKDLVRLLLDYGAHHSRADHYGTYRQTSHRSN